MYDGYNFNGTEIYNPWSILNYCYNKELKPYLEGDLPLEAAADRLKRATRHYAKRQLTWFGRNPSVHRLRRDELSDAALAEAAGRIITQSNLFTEDVRG